MPNPKYNISFFCPAYNDEKNIENVVTQASQFLQKFALNYEIIVVEDGSPDATAEVVDALARKVPHVIAIHHPKNLGYGAALKSGFKRARYEMVAYTDGDGQFNIFELEKMLPLLEQFDLVTGYRTNRVVSIKRLIQSKIFNAIINTLFGLKLKDTNCALKIFKKKVIDQIQITSDSSFIDAEVFIRAHAKGFKLAQVGVTHYPRLHGMASGAKISVMGSTILDILRYYRMMKRGALK